MDVFKLEIAQMLKEHPILHEKETYKCKYINVLEYFVRKFSPEDKWATATLALYKKALLEKPQDYKYEGFTLSEQSKTVVATKFKPFKFFSYRYCVIVDCIYINAINDKEKGEQLYSELSSIYHKRYQKKIRQVFDGLFDSSMSLDEFEQISYLADCWKRNREFLEENPIKVLVTATMSAGKSTLLNALIGKEINRTRNEACTAKIHYIMNKPYEDGYSYEKDFALELDADRQILFEDNLQNVGDEILVGTHFHSLQNRSKRLWLIDTPGVNSNKNKKHKEITEKCIRETKVDLLIYLLNGENIGTEDDRNHLEFVHQNYIGNIVFVVNKLDNYSEDEDSVERTLKTTTKELENIGFSNPTVVPISSYAGYIAKLSIFGEQLDRAAQRRIEALSEQLNEKEYQLNTYYPENLQARDDSTSEMEQLLLHSGILHLENIIYGLRGI